MEVLFAVLALIIMSTSRIKYSLLELIHISRVFITRVLWPGTLPNPVPDQRTYTKKVGSSYLV